MRLGNRIYRVWEKLELPKYFLNLHTVCATAQSVGEVRKNQRYECHLGILRLAQHKVYK